MREEAAPQELDVFIPTIGGRAEERENKVKIWRKGRE